ncbi:TetR/AcrR family transcriptional regulator [Bifidobacterium oedipodis]|uniref:AcrR family transcriptional regulator n=1 Tax=Bifidobacterium oedipodis TaxID=2675322 RepID=A0A7Y0EMZ1_9BIFI|nr:TetR/AcrR family transcriptional regulator [Bifidobacterium sp. DSM 109957]NMM93248.1 AcrR family transcriptional regulator [Bifidobacterium sp. DSM 109957]
MARPRKDSKLPSARERMEQAFWDLLRKHPYAEISMKEITRRAGVNHNTFYYHYTGMDELAEDALAHAIPQDLVSAVLHGVTGSDEALARLADDSALSERVEHLCLAASEHSSPRMRAMVRDSIRDAWFAILNIDEQAMSVNSRLSVEVALGIFMSLFSYRADRSEDIALPELLRTQSASMLRGMLPNMVMSALAADGALPERTQN